MLPWSIPGQRHRKEERGGEQSGQVVHELSAEAAQQNLVRIIVVRLVLEDGPLESSCQHRIAIGVDRLRRLFDLHERAMSACEGDGLGQIEPCVA
jgi:hypothetical protein